MTTEEVQKKIEELENRLSTLEDLEKETATKLESWTELDRIAIRKGA